MPQTDIVIVGAGAAGLMAAIHAARAGARTIVLDSQAKIGAKILVSGGGRCNVTNEDMDAAHFNGGSPEFIATALAAFGLPDTLRFFKDLGVPLKVEPEMGKVFPKSDSAETVLSALKHAVRGAGAVVIPEQPVSAISTGFVVTTPDREWRAPVVILCTGGLALPKSGSTGAGYAFAAALGHRTVRTTPALSPLLADPPVHADLAGVTLPVRLQLRQGRETIASETGSFLFTHTGYSGPAALNLSRHVARAEDAQVYARFVPQVNDGDEERFSAWLFRTQGRQTLPAAMAGYLPRRVAHFLTEAAACPVQTPLGRLYPRQRAALLEALLDQPLPVCGVDGYRKAETTAGGVCLDEVDPSTMMSRLVPGLFFAGEVLDVDGCLGGYNFQWAWTSGAIAGRSAAAYRS